MDDGSSARPQGFGRALADLFRDLGYDEGELHPDMFEWLFGLPSMRIQAFLDWFLTSMKPRQCVKRQLARQDYAIYNAMQRGSFGPRSLLIGDDLARAELACDQDKAMQTRGDDPSLDSLQTDNARLERDINEMERQLRLGNARNERLASHVQRRTMETDQHTQRHQRENDKDQFSELLVELAADRHRPPASTVTSDGLQHKIHGITQWLATPAINAQALVTASAVPSSSCIPHTSEDDGRVWKDSVYQHDVTQLKEFEEQNLRRLQQQIPTIASLVSAPATQPSVAESMLSPPPTHSRQKKTPTPPSSPWLHDSDPRDMDMREQDAAIYNKCSVELERLRRAFVVGERDSLVAQLQATRYECYLKQLTASRRQLLQQFQLMSRDTILGRKRILEASVTRTKKQLADIVQRALPEKLDELAFLKSTNILVQSYEQKLWRQEHRFLKLCLLLEGFEMQNARLRLVHRLLDAERQDLVEMDAIFQRVVGMLQEQNQQAEQRIATYQSTSGNEAARLSLSQSFLNTHDGVAHRLFDYMEQLVHAGSSGNQPSLISAENDAFRLRSFDELVRLCDAKHSSEQRVKHDVAQIHTEWKRLYDSKRSTLNQLRSELFGDVTSSTPMLLPHDVADALHRALQSKDTTEEAIERALETLRLHKRSHHVDPSKRMQQAQDMARLKRELAQQRQ